MCPVLVSSRDGNVVWEIPHPDVLPGSPRGSIVIGNIEKPPSCVGCVSIEPESYPLASIA